MHLPSSTWYWRVVVGIVSTTLGAATWIVRGRGTGGAVSAVVTAVAVAVLGTVATRYARGRKQRATAARRSQDANSSKETR